MKPDCRADFFKALDTLLMQSEVVIDRPKGSRHPRFHHIVYPMDYGYLKNTSSMDGGGIDVWVGSLCERKICGVVITADLIKKDSEIKILLSVTREEAKRICDFHNDSQYMKGMLIFREDEK